MMAVENRSLLPGIVRSESSTKEINHKKRRRSKKQNNGLETSWLYMNSVEDFSDLKTRDRVMNAVYVGSSSSEDEHSQFNPETKVEKCHDQLLYRPQLHALHKNRRERKKGLVNGKIGLYNFRTRCRTSIVNSSEFFFRFGEKEKEACDSFNFLDELSISTPSWSDDELSLEMQQKLSIKQKLEESSDENNVRPDEELEFTEDELSKVTNTIDHISISDSFPESYYGSDSKSFRSHEKNFRVSM